ncbi:TPA: Rrf2 family transcriptional regulator [Citrobacter koseri]|uniref:RrF2 family transcriptional regulator n=1 Tax=Enterobacteriaceae TaxID=543 RepID=UPI0009BAFDEB|nr:MULTISPECIES: Rrf2 family transcriptional regulator [Enterobacteriaceae]MBJ8868284.1 Rrf2 family transcriptional regulator [Citrobacter koseri]MBL4565595.1 Rrf2 family transcriptional regulator [Citrobacter koseri]SLP10372.1 Putative HTH-type transcriptional regulator ywnA [Klebsiella pneumoniae]HBS7955906.1 Rrf2 family transcriptional regulator [Klebsiella pneumoniae]HBW8611400.1 Rrf2 family transcriptional regulator [Klebsiella pneumoniae]
MRQDNKLSRTLHVLLHMARHDKVYTSEQIAMMLGTNSAVVRRTLAGLREAGFVTSVKGHHGGWRIAVAMRDISLLDIYNAVGVKQLFAIGGGDECPECAVEAVVNQALGNVLEEAEQALLSRFSEISLEDLSEGFERHFPGGTGTRGDCL